MEILIKTNEMLEKYVREIKPNPEKCREYLDRNPIMITAFVPHIGYEKASILLKEFFASGKDNLREFLKEKLGKEMVEKLLSPHNLMSLGYRDYA